MAPQALVACGRLVHNVQQNDSRWATISHYSRDSHLGSLAPTEDDQGLADAAHPSNVCLVVEVPAPGLSGSHVRWSATVLNQPTDGQGQLSKYFLLSSSLNLVQTINERYTP